MYQNIHKGFDLQEQNFAAHQNSERIRQLRHVIEKFSPVGIDRIVFTKLDEAVGVGVILNIAHRLDVQLSYLTTGQDVPDDIEVSSRRRIAEMVLNPRKPEAEASAPAKAPQVPTINAVA